MCQGVKIMVPVAEMDKFSYAWLQLDLRVRELWA